MKLLVLMTGGTIAQREVGGRMVIALSAGELVASVRTSADLEICEFNKRSGAELTFDTLFDIRDAIRARPDVDGYVLITGTDSMEEVAFGLDLMLDPEKPLAVTGAMKPSDVVGYDGLANLEHALAVAESVEARKLGVVVVMNDDVHPARYVRKQDSALMGSFRSHPGPIAQIRRGRPLFYYEGLPPMMRFADVDKPASAPRVMVWTMTIDPAFPAEALPHLDGLIVAGMGTGSVAARVVDLLAPTWTKRIPIVLASRCPVGLNFDDHYYRGSLAKYEERGFRILGYETLNPLQARIKLTLEILRGDTVPRA